MRGMASRADLPSTSGRTGTSRQPRSGKPSAASISSTTRGESANASGCVGGEEHPNRQRLVSREVQSLARRCEDEEATRDPAEHTGAVGGKIGGRRAPMGQSRCRFECQRHDFVRKFAALASDEADAAGITWRER